MFRNSHSRLCGLVAVVGVAASSWATDVPRGGADIPVGGSRQVVVNLKNTTGKDAEDVTVSISSPSGAAVPNIKDVDIQGTAKDKVDDNGDGDLDADEDDTAVDPASTSAKSILSDGQIKSNVSVDVTVTFDGPAPADAVLKVKFSDQLTNSENEKKHYDLCSVGPLGDSGFGTAAVTLGAAQIVTGVANTGSQPIGSLMMISAIPFLDVIEPSGGVVTWQGNQALVELSHPLAPGAELDLYCTLAEPILLPEQQYEMIFQGQPAQCEADFNGDGRIDTRDVLAFLNAWSARDPRADINRDGVIDTRDVLAFLNLWQAGC